MPLRTSRGLVHVASAPAQDGSRVPLAVAEMNFEHAKWWDNNVRPYIARSKETRADETWRWRRILGGVRLGGTTAGQRPTAFVVGVKRGGSEFWPCVMLAMVDRYPHLPDHSRRSVFLWFLSPAPAAFFLEGAGFRPAEVPKALMSIGMDVAITQSYNAQHRGRLGLHADLKGGEDLVNWYAAPDRGGMIRLDARLPLPRLRSLLGNDGRYFYHDETSALRASTRMDPFRGTGG